MLLYRHSLNEYSSENIVPGACCLHFVGTTMITTSFANSVIQCLSNTTRLRKFLTEFGEYDRTNQRQIDLYNDIIIELLTDVLKESREDNLAKSFADLLHDMWDGTHKSVAPTNFMVGNVHQCIVWQARPSPFSLRKRGGSSKGLSLKCNLNCVMLTLQSVVVSLTCSCVGGLPVQPSTAQLQAHNSLIISLADHYNVVRN